MNNNGKPFSAVSVFVHGNIGGKLDVVEQLNKILLYDEHITDIYVDRGCVYRNVVCFWASQKKKNVQWGTQNIKECGDLHGRLLVVFIGRDRNVLDFVRATSLAKDLKCTMLILP